MAELFKNLASTTLNGDIDDTTTSVVVNSAMGFTGGDFRILIDNEIMKVTGVSGTTLTVSRHQEGTSAAAHTSGADVKHILTVGGLDARDQNDLAAYDAYASRPAAGTPGRIFLPTDGLFLERDNGSLVGEVRPDLAHDAPGGGRLRDVGEPGQRDHRGQQRGHLPRFRSGHERREPALPGEGVSGRFLYGGNGLPAQCLGLLEAIMAAAAFASGTPAAARS